MRLLLCSNSTNFGENYLDHWAAEIVDFLGAIKQIVFVPYALDDLNAYTKKTRDRYAAMGIRVTGIHENDPRKMVTEAEAIHIGGGNTFRLLKKIYDEDLIDLIRHRVSDGMLYLGASAGTNVATISIKTTNDMPIVYPPSFEALNLVPFNINPHYIDPDPSTQHMGETRDQRISEFHEVNNAPVLGLREGALIQREGDTLTLKGKNGAKLFTKGNTPQLYNTGADLSFLLRGF